MTSIKKILISIIFVIVLFIVIYRQLNNIPLQERGRASRFSGLAEDQAISKSCSKTPPTVSLSTVDNPITIFAGQTYTFNAANSADYNNQSQLSYHWQIVSNPDNIETGMTSPVSASYNLTIPANTYKNSENAKMALVVKSNVKPYLTNSIIRNLNIVETRTPVLVLNPSSNFTAEANNNIQINSSSYVTNPQNTSSSFVTFSATATPSSGVISQPTVTTQLNNNSIIFFPYRYVPNTTNTVDININVKNVTYPTKEVSKIITMSLTLKLIEKFNASSLSYSVPNYSHISLLSFTQPRYTWPYWDKSRDSNIGIIANITEKNSALSSIIPRVSDLSYLWKAKNITTGTITTIFNNNNLPSINLSNNLVWQTINNSYEFICDISYGLFSIPILLKTPPIKYIETILIGSSSSNYIDYNVYATNDSTLDTALYQYTEFRDPITLRTIGIRINTGLPIGNQALIDRFFGSTFSYSDDINTNRKIYRISKNSEALTIVKEINSNYLRLTYDINVYGSSTSIFRFFNTSYVISSSNRFIDTIHVPPVNCQVGDWEPCSESTPSCYGGTQRKTIIQYPNATGQQCPPESDLTRSCNVDTSLCGGKGMI